MQCRPLPCLLRRSQYEKLAHNPPQRCWPTVKFKNGAAPLSQYTTACVPDWVNYCVQRTLSLDNSRKAGKMQNMGMKTVNSLHNELKIPIGWKIPSECWYYRPFCGKLNCEHVYDERRFRVSDLGTNWCDSFMFVTVVCSDQIQVFTGWFPWWGFELLSLNGSACHVNAADQLLEYGPSGAPAMHWTIAKLATCRYWKRVHIKEVIF